MLKKTFTLNLSQDQFNRVFDILVDEKIFSQERIADEVYDDAEHKEDLINEVVDVEDVLTQLTSQGGYEG